MTIHEKIAFCINLSNQIGDCLNRNLPLLDLPQQFIQNLNELIALLPNRYLPQKNMITGDSQYLLLNFPINFIPFGRIQAVLYCLDTIVPKTISKKIFISHSSKDEKIAHEFCDMLCLGVGFDKDKDIFCTSIDGLKITNGEDIREYIQDNVNYADFAILLISDNYKKSVVCLNEMGAVWAIDKKVKTYVFPNMNESEVGWLINTKAAEKINDMTALASLYDELTNFYNKPKNSKLWTAQAKKFCQKCDELLCNKRRKWWLF